MNLRVRKKGVEKFKLKRRKSRAEEQFKATRVVPWPVDSYPPWGFSTLASLQHVFTLFGVTTLVPIFFL